MIRIAYATSPPPIQQFRARLELAARRTRRSLEQRRRSLRSDAARATIMADMDTGTNDYFGRRWRQELRQTRASYETFFLCYDALIGLLCLAAHEGLKPEHEAEYRSLRSWFETHYPALKPRVAAFLSEGEMEASPSSKPPWGERHRVLSRDAFEALYFPQSVAALLESDGGSLIGRMTQTQEALAAWDHSLRCEEAAIALSPHT